MPPRVQSSDVKMQRNAKMIILVANDFCNGRFPCICNFPRPFYRAPLKGGPVLLSTTQAGPGRNFSQPRAHLIVEPCMLITLDLFRAL